MSSEKRDYTWEEEVEMRRSGRTPMPPPGPAPRIMHARAKPIQGRRVFLDGSIADTRVHPDAPGNLWIRIYHNREDYLAGRYHMTNWEKRGCQPWQVRPDPRDHVEQVGEDIIEHTYVNGSIRIKTYSSADRFERGEWRSLRSVPDHESYPKPVFNSDFDGCQINVR